MWNLPFCPRARMHRVSFVEARVSIRLLDVVQLFSEMEIRLRQEVPVEAILEEKLVLQISRPYSYFPCHRHLGVPSDPFVWTFYATVLL